MIGIISDIHGNYAALTSVFERLDGLGVKKVICLGDVAGYYCQINECCEILRSRNIHTLMGNHDWYLATGESCPRSNSANVCLDYQRNIISKDNRNWLASLSSRALIHGLDVVHGGWNDPLDEYVIPTAEYFWSIPGRYFASGHTHVQCVWQGAGRTYCNPGSVGQPRDGDPRAAFAIWDGETFTLERVEYDIPGIQASMALAGFDPYFYENLAKGARIGGKIERRML